MFYVEEDGSVTQHPSGWNFKGADMSRVYMTSRGAQTDPRCKVKFTAFANLECTAFYDAKEVIANDWKTEGLIPVNHAIIYQLED